MDLTQAETKAIAAEIRTADAEELNRVYDALGITGQFSPVDEIMRMKAEIERLRAAIKEAVIDDRALYPESTPIWAGCGCACPESEALADALKTAE